MERGLGFPTLVALALVPVVALVVWSRGGFDIFRSRPCSPTQGALCIQVSNDHLTVNDVIAYVSPSQPSLAGKTWRLVLTAGGRAYFGLTRDPSSAAAVESASHGSFPGFNVPNSLTSATELCIVVQVQTAWTWRTMTTPAPACASVS